MKYTLVKFTSAPEYMSCYKWRPILVFKNKICYMHWYKTLAWWVIFRCQHTLTSNSQLWGCLNPPCLVLFSAVDGVAKHSSVKRRQWMQARRLPKAFVSSAGISNLPITSLPVDNFKDRALWCKPTGINYNMHGWFLCRYCATGWFWWISGLRAVTMWSSASFTKRIRVTMNQSLSPTLKRPYFELPLKYATPVYRQLSYWLMGWKSVKI